MSSKREIRIIQAILFTLNLIMKKHSDKSRNVEHSISQLALYSSKMSEKTLKKRGGGRGTALEKRMEQRRLNPIINFA